MKRSTKITSIIIILFLIIAGVIVARTMIGMHFQKKPFEETKLVRCTRGKIFDVIIDLRPESNTYKKWIGVELKSDDFKMLYIPEGFAHGFQTLEDNTVTLRDRDTMEQERISVDKLHSIIGEKVNIAKYLT